MSSYLDTVDLIRLMHVSKATRRFAAPVLNKLENEIAQTRGHTDYFRGILRRTGIAKNKAVWSNLEDNGSLRKGAIIQHNAREIERRFAILKYKRSFDKEQSTVALFDAGGRFFFPSTRSNLICSMKDILG